MTPQEEKSFRRSFNLVYAIIVTWVFFYASACSGAWEKFPYATGIIAVAAFIFFLTRK